MLPIKINRDVLFGEVHGRLEDLIKTLQGDPKPNVQMLLGGGYRKRVTNDLMIGANGFANTTRLGGQWRASGIVGLEMCLLTPGSGSVDANFYYFGNVFSRDSGLFSAFKYGPGDYKFEGAYSQPLFKKWLVVRLKASRYVFHKLGKLRGYYVGSDVRTSDGMYRVEYVFGQDAMSGTYHSLGAYLTVGFQVEKVFSFQNPFSVPGQPGLRTLGRTR